MVRFFCGFWLLAAIAGGAVGGEPFSPLQADSDGRLLGRLAIDGRDVAIELVDRDQDGDYLGRTDRLSVDLDDDGRFHPLREQYAANRPMRLRGFDAADRYELLLLKNPWRARLVPIQGVGSIEVELGVLSDDAVISKVQATLVSQSGIHREIKSLNEAVEVPVGSYRLEAVLIEARDGQYWSIGFSNFNATLAYSIDVTQDQLTSCDLLGGLRLDARIGGGDYFKGKLNILPQFETESGLTLVRCRVGKLEPSDESRLTASLVDRVHADEVIDRRSSGFACGSLCPIEFEAHQAIDPSMNIALEFDIGPLGGVIRPVMPVQLPRYDRLENTNDLLDLTERKTHE